MDFWYSQPLCDVLAFPQGLFFSDNMTSLEIFDMYLMIFDINNQYLVNIWSILIKCDQFLVKSIICGYLIWDLHFLWSLSSSQSRSSLESLRKEGKEEIPQRGRIGWWGEGCTDPSPTPALHKDLLDGSLPRDVCSYLFLGQL